MKEPQEHDFPAAHDYLSLLMSDEVATRTVDRLREAPLITRKAKDLLRASGLPLLARTNPSVASDLRKIRNGEKLSPVLVVRGDSANRYPLTVADGYHRICASYYVDESLDIPCRLAEAPERSRAAARARKGASGGLAPGRVASGGC